MVVTIANVYNLTTMVEVNEIKPTDLSIIQTLLSQDGSNQQTNSKKYLRGLICERTRFDKSKTDMIFKLRKFVLFREDGVMDMFIICVINKSMMLTSIEYTAGNFIDITYYYLMKMICQRVNSKLYGLL